MKPRLPSVPVFSVFALATLLACSDDAEVADPGGMGAGRPEAPGAAEAPAESVLQYSSPSGISDTSAVVQDSEGAPDTAAGARDPGE